MAPRLFDELPALLRDTAERCIVPRFRQLQRHEVEEKSPGEMMTVADRKVEALLTPGIARAAARHQQRRLRLPARGAR